MKIFFLYALTLLLSANLYARTYYVSSSHGKDSYKGTSVNKPWKSLKKINRSNFKPGDRILFKRGDVWRGQLSPKSSGNARNYIYYGAYGEGNKPLFLGSVSKGNYSDWKLKKKDIWRVKVKRSKDVGNIILNSAADLASKKASIDALRNMNDFFSKKNKLYFNLDENPVGKYRSIEVAVTKDIVVLINNKYLTFENLALKYGGGHGFFCNNTEHITIKSCDISYIGGGFIRPNERFGNGIEFWENTNNTLVENCIIDQIYDSGVTNQGRGSNSMQQDITYRGNTISNCGLASFEYFNRSHQAKTDNIVFENNISRDAGFGWAPERPNNYGGYHILFGMNSASTGNIFIKNNELFNSKGSAIIFFNNKVWNGFEKVRFENNSYFERNKNNYLYRMFTKNKGWENYKFSESEKYIRNIKKDTSSRFE